MIKTLGTQPSCPQKLPFAMFFAVEPAFISIDKQVLETELRYNPEFQINDESRLNLIVGGQTSTSIKKSTASGTFMGKDDDDSVQDESQ